MFPENLTKEHLLLAIKEIDEQGVRKGRHSSTYDLVFEDKLYPPKLVISIANRYANGVELEPSEFLAGMDTPAFKLLVNEGFKILQKNDPVITLIKGYKAHIAKSRMKDETYKWELVKHNVGRPDTEADDFEAEIKNMKFKNMIYHLGPAVLNAIAKKDSEALRAQFKSLFNEELDLSHRVRDFNQGTLKIYRKYDKKQSHHQDERSISNYLTFFNPSKYTFYKASFYAKYCKLLGISQAKKNEKIPHYLELIQNLIDKYIIDDVELIEQVKGLIPDHYDGSNHLLLAQDILYQTLDQTVEPSYWLFQANPKIWDFETALKEERLADWTVSAHKDKIKRGDKVIIWITGANSGCYALADVISEPHFKENSPDDELWIEENSNDLKVDIEVTHNLVDNPISKDVVSDLTELKVGNQGTNFTAKKVEYETFKDIAESESSGAYIETLKLLDPEKAEQYISLLQTCVQKYGLSPSDKRISFNARPQKKRLTFIVGSRYAICLMKNKKDTVFGFISTQKMNTSSEPFKNHEGEIEAYWNIVDDITKYEGNVLTSVETELNRQNQSPHKRFENDDFVKAVFNTKTIESIDMQTNLQSKNVILYGPPGTGKTYTLKNDYFERYTSSEVTITRDEYLAKTCASLAWWEAIALAVLDLGRTKVSEILKHEFVQFKVAASNSKTVSPTIWGQLQSHTIEECEYVNVAKKSQILIFNKTKDSEWEILLDRVEEQIPDLLTLKEEIDTYQPRTEPKKRYVFTTFHQSYSYEDFIEGIKPKLNDEDNNPEDDKQIGYEIKSGLFRQIVDEAIADPINDYAIFIDEINRGNIANIFGELITLIEDDKRIGMDNYIPAQLPYSGDEFGVPPNLHIIGTMNTADRSVEALDTALRRRFSFVEMNPEPDLLKKDVYKCDGIDLAKMLDIMNRRLEKLLDKDYRIGHSYFMTINNRQDPLNELKQIFGNKILPLLQEYFYGDWGKIGLVIGNEFVKKEDDTVKFLSDGIDEEYEEYIERPVYRFTNPKDWTLASFNSIYE